MDLSKIEQIEEALTAHDGRWVVKKLIAGYGVSWGTQYVGYHLKPGTDKVIEWALRGPNFGVKYVYTTLDTFINRYGNTDDISVTDAILVDIPEGKETP